MGTFNCLRIIFVSLLYLLAARACLAQTAPAPIEEAGACPFECCSYREWETLTTVALVAEPLENSPTLRTLSKANKVRALTGKVITKVPGEFVVTRPRDSFKVNQTLYLYNYLGEGFYKAWHQGKWAEINIGCCSDGSIPGCFTKSDEDCWGRLLKKPDSTWWARIETADKKRFWTKDTDKFGNQDNCG